MSYCKHDWKEIVWWGAILTWWCKKCGCLKQENLMFAGCPVKYRKPKG